MFKIGFKYLMEHKIRSILTLAGIILGVALVLAVGILNSSMMDSYERLFTDMWGRADVIIYKDGGFSQRDLSRISTLGGVENALPVLEANFQVQGRWEDRKQVRVIGVDVTEEIHMRDYYFKHGEWFDGGNRDQIILTEKSAAQLNARLYETVRIVTRRGVREFTVTGILEDKGGGRTQWGNRAFMPINTLRRLLNRPGGISRIDISLEDRESVLNQTEHIKSLFDQEIRFQTVGQNVERMNQNLSSMWFGYNIVLIVVIFVGCFLIYNTFSVAVLQRIKTIGMLRAIGMTRKQTVKMVMAEGLLLGITGTVAGLGLGIVMGRFLLAVQAQEFHFNFDQYNIPFTSLLMAVSAGITMPLISVIIPGVAAGRHKPIEALKIDEEGYCSEKEPVVTDENKGLLGVVLILTAFMIIGISFFTGEENMGIKMAVTAILVFLTGIVMVVPQLIKWHSRVFSPVMGIVMGREGILSGRNILKNKNRSAVAVSVIGIGIIMALGFNGMFNSLETSMSNYFNNTFRYDLVVSHQSGNVSNYDNVYRKLRQIKDIEHITYVFDGRCQIVNTDNWIKAMGIEPAEYRNVAFLDVVQGDLDNIYMELRKEDTVVITTWLSNEYGYGIGDTVYFDINRRRAVPLRVVGIVLDYDWGGSKVIVNRNLLDSAYGFRRVSSILVKSKPYTDLDLMAERVARVLGDNNMDIKTVYQERETFLSGWITASGTFDIINWVALVMAVLGLTNTLIMSIYERKKEIGLMRSVGASKGQISRMIFGESLMLGLLSGIIGIMGGTVFIVLITRGMEAFANIYVYTHYPYGFMSVSFLLVIICSLAGACYPARIAANTDIIETIKSE